MLTDVIRSLGLKRATFADQLGIGRAYLSGLESGKKRPSLELAVRIERLTGGAVPVACWVDDMVGITPANQPAAQAAPNSEIHHDPSPEQA